MACCKRRIALAGYDGLRPSSRFPVDPTVGEGGNGNGWWNPADPLSGGATSDADKSSTHSLRQLNAIVCHRTTVSCFPEIVDWNPGTCQAQWAAAALAIINVDEQ